MSRYSTLRPISKKQAAIMRKWKATTVDRAERLGGICEWCREWGSLIHKYNPLTGHHMIKRRHNDHSEANCFVCHWLCHQEIDDNSIKVWRGIKGVYAEGDERE